MINEHIRTVFTNPNSVLQTIDEELHLLKGLIGRRSIYDKIVLLIPVMLTPVINLIIQKQHITLFEYRSKFEYRSNRISTYRGHKLLFTGYRPNTIVLYNPEYTDDTKFITIIYIDGIKKE